MSDQPTTSLSDSTGRSRPLIFVIGAVIFGLVFGIVWMQSAKYEPLVIGKMAPDFALSDLSDKPYRLSDFRGKVVFLNFWATWCKPCREEMPSMEVLNKNFEKDGLVILAVSIDRVTTTKDIPPFVKGMNLTFPVLIDSWGKTDKPYKRMGVPETFIIDQEGIIREIVIGPRDWTRIDSLQILTKLLNVTPKTAAESSIVLERKRG
ncbi:Thiol-disulfide oxidoreductase ResA [Nitrospira sp. KM1]|uniref:TlpA disulfide reductase family protein n=1 Tax=Nitrospira sp. KM1 TaxID=1936990 RepID=UPI0013A75468|nr:TlpA disulfide reductase family protein [Nitrospira sp. KM1]BCA55911.1 Thiol-disulfide oxidoreductase ResA [Nitrospira sp. KM1]